MWESMFVWNQCKIKQSHILPISLITIQKQQGDIWKLDLFLQYYQNLPKIKYSFGKMNLAHWDTAPESNCCKFNWLDMI